jgi:hypothetical protein
VAYQIARPFLAPLVDGAEVAQLMDERDRFLALIRDLDMEFATGKLGEDEYRSLRARRVGEADEIERKLADLVGEQAASEPELEEIEGQPELEEIEGDTGHEEIRSDSDDDLERAIAARKQAMQDHGCSHCGAVVDPDDRFCRQCGAELATAQAR